MSKYIVRIAENTVLSIVLEAESEDDAAELAQEIYTNEGTDQFSEDEFDWNLHSTYIIDKPRKEA